VQGTKCTARRRVALSGLWAAGAASRFLYSEINRRSPSLPFSLRAVDEDKRGRLGIGEIVTHGLLQPFPVLTEKAGELVAQFKFTALLTGTGTHCITPLTAPFAKSELSITDPELTKLLQTSAAPAKKKKNKKDAKAVVEPDAATNAAGASA